MGRQQALTGKQKRDREKVEMGRAIMMELRTQRARQNLGKLEFCEKIGICNNTWDTWEKKNLATAKLWDVIDVMLRAGITPQSLVKEERS